jgi:hypothetical protein
MLSVADNSFMATVGKPHEREYRETFRYRTKLARIEEAQANIEDAAQRLDLKLVAVEAMPGRRGNATLEITVIGAAKSITALRETLNDISIFSSMPGGGEDVGSMLLGAIMGPVMDEAATRTRRGLWAVQRRRRGTESQDAGLED